MGKTYAEQIAEWRSYRQQQEQAQRLDEIRAEYAEAQRERDRAVADGDVETATDRDNDCLYLERQWAEIAPPPQIDPGWLNLAEGTKLSCSVMARKVIRPSTRPMPT